jgi:hypothetical protein
MTEAVSYSILTVEANFNTRPVHVGIVVAGMALKQYFPYPFGFCNPVQVYGKKINDMMW